jgi:hypothetical protein
MYLELSQWDTGLSKYGTRPISYILTYLLTIMLECKLFTLPTRISLQVMQIKVNSIYSFMQNIPTKYQ